MSALLSWKRLKSFLQEPGGFILTGAVRTGHLNLCNHLGCCLRHRYTLLHKHLSLRRSLRLLRRLLRHLRFGHFLYLGTLLRYLRLLANVMS